MQLMMLKKPFWGWIEIQKGLAAEYLLEYRRELCILVRKGMNSRFSISTFIICITWFWGFGGNWCQNTDNQVIEYLCSLDVILLS